MHTWALFSCSSLITLTAYNLSHLPKTPKPAAEPEPDPSDQLTEDTKFSLDVMDGQFPEFERIAQPALPDQPRLSKVDERPGYNPALYDPLQYPVREVDLVGALPRANLPGGIAYRVDAVAPLPTLLPPPGGNPFPVANPLPTAIAAAPPTAPRPRPEQATATPRFAPRATPAPIAQVPTTPAPPATPLPSVEPSTDTDIVSVDMVSVADTPNLFATLPEHAVPIAPMPQPAAVELATPQAAPADLAMIDVVAFDPLAQMTDSSVTVMPDAVPVAVEVSPIALEAAPVPLEVSPVATEPVASMDLAMSRHDLIEGYCDRPLADTSEATRVAVCDGGTSE